ncbi:MAG: hypothetical protein KatS3mg009_1686 [Acidimicrobiia bacterium]|nr:MAG: hypothetical protein KatS3mg009_1686 [Acidimicrobiia bacterium]
MLAAEVALGELRPDAGHEHATEALALARTARLPEVEALALELLGRIAREVDLTRAEAAFRAAAEVADANDLMLRRISALHELGTLDVYRVGRPTGCSSRVSSRSQIGDLALAAVRGASTPGIVHRDAPRARAVRRASLDAGARRGRSGTGCRSSQGAAEAVALGRRPCSPATTPPPSRTCGSARGSPTTPTAAASRTGSGGR